MTSKEKAEQLLKKFDVKHQMKFSEKRGTFPISMYNSQIKQCAIACVGEIISNNSELLDGINYHEELNYWCEVIAQIQSEK